MKYLRGKKRRSQVGWKNWKKEEHLNDLEGDAENIGMNI